VAELVEARVPPRVVRAAGPEEPPHHAVRIAKRGDRAADPQALEALLPELLHHHRELVELEAGVDAGVAPHRDQG
jgi:hypothetical protein